MKISPNQKTDPTQYGRVARWPLDGNTGKLRTASDGKVYAMEAYRLPLSNAQGAIALNGTWYVMTSSGVNNMVNCTIHILELRRLIARRLLVQRISITGRNETRFGL